jgi:hypothetical protein
MAPSPTTSAAPSVPPGDVAIAVTLDPTVEQTEAQMLWNRYMENPSKGKHPYNKTAVLLLSWKNGDLNTGPEA